MTDRSNSHTPISSVEPIVDDCTTNSTVENTVKNTLDGSSNCPDDSSNGNVAPTGEVTDKARAQRQAKKSENVSIKGSTTTPQNSEQSDPESLSVIPDEAFDQLDQSAQSDQLNPNLESANFAEPTDVNVTIVQSHLRGIIEAMVFASDKPLSTADIAKNANATRAQVVALLAEIQAFYQHRGIQLVEVAGGYAFRTAAAYGSFVRQVTTRRPVKLTRAQLETLAIVAYRQPITRPEVDDVRGVDSGPVLKTLLERGILRILGKRDEPGRPIIYGTTSAFLSLFNLKSLKDLPSLREFAELTDDSKRTFDKLMTSQQMQWDAPQPSGTTASWNAASPRDSSTLKPTKDTSASSTGNDKDINATDTNNAIPPNANTATTHRDDVDIYDSDFDISIDSDIVSEENGAIDSGTERDIDFEYDDGTSSNDDVISDVDYGDLDLDE